MELGAYGSMEIRQGLPVSNLLIALSDMMLIRYSARSVIERRQWEEEEKDFVGPRPRK